MRLRARKLVAQAFGLSFKVAVAATLVLPLCAAEWQVDFVDPGGGGKWSVIRIDSNGNAHVGYGNEAFHEVRYAFWDRLLRKWFTMVVDNRSLGFLSMALDSQQRPHMAFQMYGASRLKYAHWDNGWKVQELSTGASLMEYYTSIALDSHDHPFIGYYEVLRPGALEYVLHLRTIHQTDDQWEVTSVDSTAGSGKFNSLASSPDGTHIGIGYANVKDENASLRYGQWTGTRWEHEILLGAGERRHTWSVATALGNDGTPHITFTDLDTRTIRYATRRNGHWIFEDVSGFRREAFPDRNGIAVDEEGNPYITFVDAGLRALKFAYRVGNRWVTEVIEGSATGYTSSIQVRNHEVMITAYDESTNSLKCYHRTISGPETSAATKPRPQ